MRKEKVEVKENSNLVVTLSEGNKSLIKELDSKLLELNKQYNILNSQKQNILNAILNEKPEVVGTNKKFQLNKDYNLEEVIKEEQPT